LATPIVFPRFKAFVQGTNDPLSGGLLYTYAAGTSTPLATYAEATAATANANPVVLDSNGEATIFPGASSYKLILKNSAGVTQWTLDNVSYTGLQDSISGHNFLIDGGFEQWQEATTYTGAATLKLLDAWSVAIPTGTASNFTISRQTSGRSGSKYCMRIQRNAAATDVGQVSLIQDLETADSLALQEQQVVLSFWARVGANWSGSVNSFVYSGTGTDEAWRTAGGYTGQATVATNSGALSLSTSWQQFIITSSDAALSSLTQVGALPFYHITFSGTAGASDYIDIDDVQLEIGTSVSAFERINAGELLRQGQRRYYKTFAQATAPAQNAGTVGAYFLPPQDVAAATASYTPSVPMPGWMRDITGTMTLYNPSAANAQIRNSTVAADCSASTSVPASNEAHLTFTSAAGSAAGNVNLVHYVIDKRI